MAFRFVHSADIHLDSPLRSLALRDPRLAELIGTATRRAFTRVIDLCLAEQVDALVLAGDLYDGDQTSMKTALYLGSELKRLDAAGIRSFIIRGNHDHLSRITKELVLPDTAMVFGGRADVAVIKTSTLPIAVHGLSFAQANARESLLVKYKPPLEDAINIGIMHTSLDGAPGHDPYAPCAARDLAASGFRYWALGHIHGRSVTEGRCSIVMSGMPQGRDIGEAGVKSATLVTVSDDGTFTAEARRTSVAQFERLTVDVSGARDWRDIAVAMGGALERARSAAACEHLVARLELTGTSTLAWRMRRDSDLLRTEAEARAAALGGTWIDKVEVRALAGTAPTVGGPFDELRRSMLEDVCGSPANTEAIMASIDELRQHLPPECRGILGEGEDAMRALAMTLATRGCDDVLARLIPDGEARRDAH